MGKFEFEKYRDDLAKQLKETRTEEVGREKAKKSLAEAKDTENYKDSKKLHQIRNDLTRQAVVESVDFPERIDDPEKWDVEDVSDRIPEEYKYWIDKGILGEVGSKIYPNVEDNEKRWAIGKRLEDVRKRPGRGDLGSDDPDYDDERLFYQEKLLAQELDKFRDDLSGHRLLNKHNLNHLVMGHGGGAKQFLGRAFDRYSKIEGSRTGDNINTGFWMNIAAAGKIYSSVNRQTVIISPDNVSARRFFEQRFHPPIEGLLGKFSEEERGKPGSVEQKLRKMIVFDGGEFQGFHVSSFRGDPDYARLVFLAGLPIAKPRDGGSAILFPLEGLDEAETRHADKDYSKVSVEENWMDIADCIIDLPQRKVWKRKYSEAEASEVKVNKQKYKEWIEKNILHCTIEEFIASAKK